MKISDTPFFKTTTPTLPAPPFSWEGKLPLLLFFLENFENSTPDYFGCLRLDAFDFQLKFNFKYSNFVLKEN